MNKEINKDKFLETTTNKKLINLGKGIRINKNSPVYSYGRVSDTFILYCNKVLLK